MKVVTQYKTRLYDISDYSKKIKIFSDMNTTMNYGDTFKDLMTQEGYKRFVANRIFYRPVEVCNKGKFNLKFSDIKYTLISSDESKIVMEYTLHLQATNPGSNKTEMAEETGEVRLIKQDNSWKVDGDWFRTPELFQQVLQGRITGGAHWSF